MKLPDRLREVGFTQPVEAFLRENEGRAFRPSELVRDFATPIVLIAGMTSVSSLHQKILASL